MNIKRLTSLAALLGLAVVGIAATPHEAKAWWRGGIGVGVWVPPRGRGTAARLRGAATGRLRSAPTARVLSAPRPGLDSAALGRAVLGSRPLVLIPGSVTIDGEAIDEVVNRVHR